MRAVRITGDMYAFLVSPCGFKSGKAVPYAVRQILDQVFKIRDQIKLLPHGVGDVFRLPVPAAGQDRPVERQQRAAALAHFSRKMIAAILHVGKQLVLLGYVAVVGCGKDRLEP